MDISRAGRLNASYTLSMASFSDGGGPPPADTRTQSMELLPAVQHSHSYTTMMTFTPIKSTVTTGPAGRNGGAENLYKLQLVP